MKLIELHILQRMLKDLAALFQTGEAAGMRLLILTNEPNCQGFKIERWGNPDRRDTDIRGLWLVAEWSSF